MDHGVFNYILGTRVYATSYFDATQQIISWAQTSKSYYVIAANVHVVMMAHDDSKYRSVVNGAGLVTPDGMPLVWALRLMGFKNQQRVYGPDLTLKICDQAAEEGVPVFFYGSTPETLNALRQNLSKRYPSLQIAGMYSPPFRALTSEEDEAGIKRINDSGAKIVFVGLGAPKQEYWMAAHKGRINAVMLGVGAAFDFHAGQVKQAPTRLQKMGLEWLFRLFMEPRRLWRRYLYYNPRYIALLSLQLLGIRNFEKNIAK